MSSEHDRWEELNRWRVRAARHAASAMAREWEPGLRTELDTCIAQWRFGDALVIAGELDARVFYGCEGSVTEEGGRRRLTDEWVGQRGAEIMKLFGESLSPRPERSGRDARMARLGLRGG